MADQLEASPLPSPVESAEKNESNPLSRDQYKAAVGMVATETADKNLLPDEKNLVEAATLLESTPDSAKAYLKRLGLSDRQVQDIQNFNNQMKGRGMPDSVRGRMVDQRVKSAVNLLKLRSGEVGSKSTKLSDLFSRDRILLIDQNNQSFDKLSQAIGESIISLQREGIKTMLLPITQEALKYLRDKGRDQHPEDYQRRIAQGAINLKDPDLSAMEDVIDMIDSTIDPKTGKPFVQIKPIISNPNAPGDLVGGRPNVWKNDPKKERQYPLDQVIEEYLGNEKNPRVDGGVVAIMKKVPSYFGEESIKPEEVRKSLEDRLQKSNLEGSLRSAKLNPDGSFAETTPPQELPLQAA